MKSALIEQHTASEKKIEKISLDTIQTKGLQTREATNQDKVKEYAEIYRAGGAMPPIVVFSEGGDEFHLADGHHRVAGAKLAKLEEIEGLIKKGDRRDALWYATAANAQHGLARSNEDKRRAVVLILADEEWRKLSDAQLAEHASVSDRLVAKIRKEIGAESATRKGKDGKTRTKPTKKPPKPSIPPGTLTVEMIRRSYCAQIVAESKAPPVLRHAVLVNDKHYVDTGGTLTRLFEESDFKSQYPKVKVGKYYDLCSPENGYRGIKVVYKGQPCVLGGRDTEIELDVRTGLPPTPPTKLAPGPEEITTPANITPAGPQIEQPDSTVENAGPKLVQLPGEDLFQETPPSPKAEKAPPQTIGDRVLLAERGIIAEKLLKGKPQWTGTDGDLFLLALIVGVPTRKQAWIDSARANAQHLFIEALRSEVADRVRNGEHTNRGWPVVPELCRLWGLDYQALHLLAQHAAEKGGVA